MSIAMKWMGKCKDLAYTWQLPMDPIRRHQVFLLYSSGHDRLAEEVFYQTFIIDGLFSRDFSFSFSVVRPC